MLLPRGAQSWLGLAPNILNMNICTLLDFILESKVILYCELLYGGAHYTVGWLTPTKLLPSSLQLLLNSSRMLNIGDMNIKHLWDLGRQYT